MKQLLLALWTFLVFLPAEAGIIIGEEPYQVIQGAHTLLNMPESAAFSLSGECLAVANLWSRQVTVFRRIEGSDTHYDPTPASIVTDPANLRDPHDAKFTPNGKYLAVVSRGADKVLFYPFKKNSHYEIKEKPDFILKESSGLASPSILDISPSGEILAIANRWGTIAFYKRSGGTYAKNPYQVFTKELFYQHGIASPHAVAFSPDGKTIATLHKRYGSDSKAQGRSALVIFEKETGTSQKFKTVPVFISFAEQLPHHCVAFHPSGMYLAVADGTAGVRIFEKVGGGFDLIFTIPAIPDSPNGEGPKGVAFSPDGKILALTTSSPNGVRLYDVQVE